MSSLVSSRSLEAKRWVVSIDVLVSVDILVLVVTPQVSVAVVSRVLGLVVGRGAGGVVAVGRVVGVLVLCGVAGVARVDMAGSAGHTVAQVESPVAQVESPVGAGQALAGVLVVDRGGVVGGGRLHLLGQDHGLGVGVGGGQGQGEQQQKSGEHAGGWGLGGGGWRYWRNLARLQAFKEAFW